MIGPAARRDTAVMAPHAAPATSAADARTTILLIEDHGDIREGLQELLRREGYAVEAAGNGREALNMLHQGLRPSIIVTDLMMPVMGGFEFRQEQMSHPKFRDIPLIVYSGVTDPREKAQQLRADAYIAKPIDMDGLIELVRRHCLK